MSSRSSEYPGFGEMFEDVMAAVTGQSPAQSKVRTLTLTVQRPIVTIPLPGSPEVWIIMFQFDTNLRFEGAQDRLLSRALEIAAKASLSKELKGDDVKRIRAELAAAKLDAGSKGQISCFLSIGNSVTASDRDKRITTVAAMLCDLLNLETAQIARSNGTNSTVKGRL